MLKKLIAVVGLATTLGVAAPAFADWHHGPVARPVAHAGYGYGRGYGYGHGYGYGYGRRAGWEHRRWEYRAPRYYRHW
ncbi:MAG TPA: hypothetical protein VGL86_24490 [Polyangia bacterium]|jgi:hypothetical protein